MVDIVKVENERDFQNVAAMADIIWREHYIPIIGVNQVMYMLEKFQSMQAIAWQAREGYNYYFLYFNNELSGYTAIKIEKDVLFLSKIYVLSTYRGKKIGKAALTFIENFAKKHNLKTIRLTVNIHNSNSIKAYEKLGFKKKGSIVIDIGNGFVMDDFEMTKSIN